MRTNYLAFSILAAFLLSSCTAGVNKDLLSGLKISNSGLSYNDAYLSRAQVKLNTSEYEIGDTIYLYIDGVEGYVEKDGKVKIGASIVITDPSGAKIADFPDLFEQYDSTGLSKSDASVVQLRIFVLSPLVAGPKYNWKSKVWDKNGKGEINSEVEFTVK